MYTYFADKNQYPTNAHGWVDYPAFRPCSDEVVQFTARVNPTHTRTTVGYFVWNIAVTDPVKCIELAPANGGTIDVRPLDPSRIIAWRHLDKPMPPPPETITDKFCREMSQWLFNSYGMIICPTAVQQFIAERPVMLIPDVNNDMRNLEIDAVLHAAGILSREGRPHDVEVLKSMLMRVYDHVLYH